MLVGYCSLARLAAYFEMPALIAEMSATARSEFVAQRERGVDAGVDHAAARIALGPEAALGEIEAAAEIVERLAAAIRARAQSVLANPPRPSIAAGLAVKPRAPSCAARIALRAPCPTCSGLVMVP